MMKQKQYPIASTFDCHGIPQGANAPGYEERSQYVPAIDQLHRFDVDGLRVVLNWWAAVMSSQITEGLFLYGPVGCGKTSTLVQVAARLNIPVYEKTFHERVTFNELVAQMNIADGATYLTYGPLAKAMGVDGKPGIFLANEIDKASPGVLSGLHEVLCGNPLDVLGRDVIKPMPGFAIAATANTNLLGMNMHIHRGAHVHDPAFADRFWVLPRQYPEPDLEKEIVLKRVPKATSEIAERMIKVANDVRHSSDDEKGQAIDFVMSTRFLIRWATTVVKFKSMSVQPLESLLFALDVAGISLAEPEVREAIREITRNVMDGTSTATAAATP
jgi:cobaltochelatase CobS